MFKKCEYITSMGMFQSYPNKDGLAEFGFFGRSNVGKSSFINALTNKKNLARTSSEPGKTKVISFFLIDDSFYLVDFPGYGYAKRDKKTIEEFGKFIEDFLNKSKNLKIAFLLIDLKVGPTEDDILMFNYLKYLNINVKIIVTKIDKIGKTLRYRHIKVVAKKLDLKMDDLILTSSSTKEGVDKVISIIEEY